MYCKFQMDPLPLSYSISNTPDTSAQRLPFCVDGGGFYRTGPQYYTKREGMPSYLLLFTTGGEGMATYRSHTHSLREGTGILINCREYHEYKTAAGGYWEFFYLHFNGASVPAYCDLLDNESSVIMCASPDADEIKRNMEDIMSTMRSGHILRQVTISDHISRLLTRLVTARENFQQNPQKQKYRAELERAFQYIQEHCCESFSVDDVIRQTFFSKYYFLRIFKEYTGQSLYDYVIHLRVNRAKDLLKQTNYTIKEIASMTGFSDATNFIRNFKKLVKTTPLQYRKYFIT